MIASMHSDQSFFDQAWSLLRRGVVDKRHGFNIGTFTTLGTTTDESPIQIPVSRTVVLRAVDMTAGTLNCYTDIRSQKVKHLLEHPYASWCLWDKRSRIQVTAYGAVEIVHDDTARQRYLSLPKHSRKAYATHAAPGLTLAGDSSDGLPDNWEELDLQATDYAAEHFAILTTRLLSMDVLALSRDGHQRLRATRQKVGGTWLLKWVVP